MSGRTVMGVGVAFIDGLNKTKDVGEPVYRDFNNVFIKFCLLNHGLID